MSTEIFKNMPPAYTQTPQAPIATQAAKPNNEITVKEAMAAKNVGDTYESSAVKTANKGGIKGFIARVKSGFATLGEYTKGFIRGITSGVVAGSVVYTAGSIINSIKTKTAEKAGTTAKRLPNKALAVAIGVASLAINLWKSSLNANEKRSDIYHRWIGH